MDHDFMLTNDFAGEAFLSLNTIPGISGEEISGFSALTPLTMTLTQPRRSGGKFNEGLQTKFGTKWRNGGNWYSQIM